MKKLISFLASALCAASLSAAVTGYTPSGSVSGTAGLSASDQATLNAAVTYDTNVADFIKWAGIADKRAKDHLNYSVLAIKRLNEWTNCVDLMVFQPRFKPTNHLSIMGRVWTASNELYSAGNAWSQGAYSGGTNSIVLNLGRDLTNFTFFVSYTQDAADADLFGKSVLGATYLAGIQNSNDNSSVAVSTAGNGNGQRMWAANAGNWFNQANVASYDYTKFSTLRSGGFRPEILTARTVVIISGNTNGQLQAWVNGSQVCFENPTPDTNLVTLTNLTVLNQLRLFGHDSTWLTNSGGGAYWTNAAKVTIGSAGVFAKRCDANLAKAIERFATGVEDADDFVELAGSSIMSFNAWAGGGGYCPFTNSLIQAMQNINPEKLVIDSACPGSFVGNWTNCVHGWSNGIVWVPVASMLEKERWNTISIKTDAPRNNAFNASSSYLTPESCLSVAAGFAALWTNGISWHWVDTPSTLSATLTNNVSWVKTCQSARTNSIFTKFYPVGKFITLEHLATISQDSPPTHINGKTYATMAANRAFASLISDKGWPLNFTSVTNLGAVTPYNMTNITFYPVKLTIQGTSLDVYKNGAAQITGLTGVWPMTVYPGDVVNVTNASNLIYDSTQQ